jgi:four helix bundle protein
VFFGVSEGFLSARSVLRGSAMDKILSFRDLDVWQLAMDLVDSVIADLKAMPRIEFDLKRQMQRAAISVPSNVAEGWRRKKKRLAYQNHVSIAMGSQGELDTQLEIAFRNGFLKRENCARTLELCRRVGLMLNRLHDSLDS